MRSTVFLDYAADLRSVPVDRATERELAWARRRQRGWSADPPASWAYFRSGIEDAREAVGAVLGAPAERIVFTDGTLAGLRTLVAGSLGVGLLGPGDRVLVTDREYGATYRELAPFDTRVVAVDGPDPAVVSAIVEACRAARPRLVVASHVTLFEGRVLPIAEAIRAVRDQMGEDAPVFAIDGAQALGNVPVNVGEIGAELYFGCFHKWIQGPASTGFLYVAHRGVLEGVAEHAHLLACHPSVAADATECSRIGLQLPETSVLGGHLRRRPSARRGSGGVTAGLLRAAFEADPRLAPALLPVRDATRSGIVALALPSGAEAVAPRIDAALRSREGMGRPVAATTHVPRIPARTAALGVFRPSVLRFACVDEWSDPSLVGPVTARVASVWAELLGRG